MLGVPPPWNAKPAVTDGGVVAGELAHLVTREVDAEADPMDRSRHRELESLPALHHALCRHLQDAVLREQPHEFLGSTVVPVVAVLGAELTEGVAVGQAVAIRTHHACSVTTPVDCCRARGSVASSKP